jgi:hypothetical protein
MIHIQRQVKQAEKKTVVVGAKLQKNNVTLLHNIKRL